MNELMEVRIFKGLPLADLQTIFYKCDLKGLSQKEKLSIFLEWVFTSDEYLKVDAPPVTKRRLIAMTGRLRELFPDMRKTGGYKELANIIRDDVYGKACNGSKKIDSCSTVEERVNFVDSFLSYYSDRSIATMCRNFFFDFFTHPYELTTQECNVLRKYGWF